MLKKICIFTSIFFILFLIKNTQYLDKKDVISNPSNNLIDVSQKQMFFLDCELKFVIFKKTLDGVMFLKNENFRILLYDKKDKKIDVGCNEKYFWYWSKNEEKDTLFYSDRVDMDYVLEDSYRPSWMLDVFKNINKPGENFNLLKDNKILSKANILENNIIKFYLVKENITLLFKIKNAFNKNFDESVFDMPEDNYKILNKMLRPTKSSSP
jgi:hypothetical protein